MPKHKNTKGLKKTKVKTPPKSKVSNKKKK